MTDLYQPAVPAPVRTVVYVVGLIIGFASILAIGLGAILWPEQAATIAASAGVVGTAVGWLASALGVVYRPTAQHATPAADTPAAVAIDPLTIPAVATVDQLTEMIETINTERGDHGTNSY